MTQQEVIDLMKSSKSEEDWNKNCDLVKQKCNGYPPFWYKEIILSGLADEIMQKFGETTEIHIVTFQFNK